MKFQDKLQVIRKERGLSQEGLAGIIGISRQAVAKWELGQGYPDIENLICLSSLFKISIDKLIKEEDQNYFLAHIKEETIYNEEMISFLCRAKKSTYAVKSAETVSSRPKSHDLEYIEGEYKYIDSYLGSEKFSGEEAVWYQGDPRWSMNYTGRILSESFSGDFLKEALLLVSTELPFRGPSLYRNGDYIYHSNVNGTFEWFQGYEEIFCERTKVFECYYHGGIVK
jgi:transcriptional regulator with XRE-family HTH domain